MKKIVWIVVSILLFVLFILPAVGFGILQWGILPPERLTPLVVEKANEYIDAHLACERVELAYWETYPYLGVRLTNGRVVTHQAEDSLFSFHKIILAVNPADYLFEKKITIKYAKIESPRFYGLVDENGQANWDIYHSEPDSLSTEAEETTLPPIDLQKVHITDGHFVYNDLQQALYTEVDGFFMHLYGSLQHGENKLDLETGLSSLRFESPSYTLSNKLALRLKSRLQLANQYRKVTLQGAELMINNLPFTADGSIISLPETGRTAIDLAFGLRVSDLNDLLHFIPDAYFKNREKTIAKGRILLEGTVQGELGDSVVPTVNLCCKVDNGSYRLEGVKQGIDTLQMDVDLHLNGANPDSSSIYVEQFRVIGPNIAWSLTGEAHHIFGNPAIRAELDGKINFTKLGQEFLNPDTLQVDGLMDANLKAAFTLEDLLNSHFGRIQAEGRLRLDRFKALSKTLDLDMYIAGANLAVAEVKEESQYMNAKGLLRATMTVDTMNIHYKDEIGTNVSHFSMVANTARIIDTTAIIPMTTRIEFDKLRTKLPDSTWVSTGKTVLLGGIKASASNKKIPTVGASITIDTLKYILIPQRTGLVLAGNTFNLEALPYREVILERRKSRGDTTTIRRTPRLRTDSLRRKTASTVDTTDFTSRFLRRWEVRGNISFNQLRVFSRLFPLPVRMEKTSMTYNTNSMSLNNARLHLGKSDLTLSGEVSRLRQAMLRGGKLTGKFTLHSDLIDCNQLMKAINSGMQFAEQLDNRTLGTFDEDSLSHMNNIQALEMDEMEADTTNQLFLVPNFLDLTFHLNAKQIHFNDLQLKDTRGEVVVRDQSINLSNLHMDSNIGSGKLTMVYTTKNRQQATIGFDLDMNHILVNKLIDLYPAIDTLVPMLRSFEGVVDCQMTATCQTDSTMSVLLPTVNSSCYLAGKNMVLLDGETFTEISKKLMFKNKERNMIDSIAVDLAIRDNQIEVFPFLVEMDRYKVAVGGTHNLDMTFDYHISVLKSPVPFKLGIDINGNLDDFKYKIVKCRYKDFLQPAKQAELDSTRRNIRQNIREAVRKQIREAAPELVSSLPPIASVDTTATVREPSL